MWSPETTIITACPERLLGRRNLKSLMSRKIIKMKKNLFTLTLVALLTGQLAVLQAQTLFIENFETSPVSSILNPIETVLVNGPSPCGKASRGNTTDFNSTNVNFNNAQNPSYFLGVNPETPCGGFYFATLNTASLNFSGQESLRFKCRYFISSTLNWGPDSLKITFSDGTSNFVIDSEFSVTDNWSNLDISLPNFLIASAVTITIKMSAGEGIGLDDIEVINVNSTTVGLEQYNSNNKVNYYPNPFFSETVLQTDHILSSATLTVYNSFGQTVAQINNISGQTVSLSRNNLPSGVYYIWLTEENNIIAIDRLVIVDK